MDRAAHHRRFRIDGHRVKPTRPAKEHSFHVDDTIALLARVCEQQDTLAAAIGAELVADPFVFILDLDASRRCLRTSSPSGWRSSRSISGSNRSHRKPSTRGLALRRSASPQATGRRARAGPGARLGHPMWMAVNNELPRAPRRYTFGPWVFPEPSSQLAAGTPLQGLDPLPRSGSRPAPWRERRRPRKGHRGHGRRSR